MLRAVWRNLFKLNASAPCWRDGNASRPVADSEGEIAPTGKAFRVRMMASFEFEPGTASIICERPYFDRRAVVTALGLG